VAALALAGAGPGSAATSGPLTVSRTPPSASLAASRLAFTSWSIAGFARYDGLLGGQTSSLTLYNQSHEPVATWSFIGGFPSKVDVGGLESDVTVACGVVALELGGPCLAVGAVIGIGTVRIAEHDLRPGGRLLWEIVFSRALCPRCVAN
jgi:hypothetical protein